MNGANDSDPWRIMAHGCFASNASSRRFATRGEAETFAAQLRVKFKLESFEVYDEREGTPGRK